MPRLRHIGAFAIVVLVCAALLAILVPACLAPGCGPMIAGHGIGGALAGLLGCAHMLFPQDADPGLIVQLLTYAFVAVMAFTLKAPFRPLRVVGYSGGEFDIAHGPPDDPLRGRLLI